jgi:hypothetical protein
MRLIYVLHITAGSLALLSGYVALYSAKGAATHRKSGTVFACAILIMCVAGATLAVVRNAAPAINIPAALITSYLVITSLTTFRPLPQRLRWAGVALTLIALAVGVTNLSYAYEALTSADGTSHGFPAFPFVLFGTIGMLGGALDIRMMRKGELKGPSRIVRHLWRMSMALWIAALSFFIGQAKVIPEPIRIMPLLALPVLAVLATMLYWLWRVRIRKSVRGLTRIRTADAILR